MEPPDQEIPHERKSAQYSHADDDAGDGTKDYNELHPASPGYPTQDASPSHQYTTHDVSPSHQYPTHDASPSHQYPTQDPSPLHQYAPYNQPLQFQHQQAYIDQYPPPGAGQVSPYQSVPGSFPQKDARMYHQQQQPPMTQFPPGTVLYTPSGPYSPPETDPNAQTGGAQLYPGYGATQPMAPSPQGNMGSVTFVNPGMVEEKEPNTYMCLSFLACLFLFCPTGCVAIYYSSQTRDAIKEGNLVEAKKRSDKTRYMLKVTVVIFLICCFAAVLWKYVIAPNFWYTYHNG